jgi:hypothetical protein
MAAGTRPGRLLVTLAVLASSSLAFAQSPPEPGQQPSLTQNVPSVSSAESSAEPAEAEKLDTPPEPKLASCAVVTVTPGPVRADGHPWDTLATEPPDIGIAEATTGTMAQCDDTWTCSLTLTPKTNALELMLTDADPIGGDDPMGTGTCAIGKICSWPLAKVSVKAC